MAQYTDSTNDESDRTIMTVDDLVERLDGLDRLGNDIKQMVEAEASRTTGRYRHLLEEQLRYLGAVEDAIELSEQRIKGRTDRMERTIAVLMTVSAVTLLVVTLIATGVL